MVDNSLVEMQRQLDVIQSWLFETTEPFDDWDYDGEELVILLKGNIIEIHAKEEMKIFIKGLK